MVTYRVLVVDDNKNQREQMRRVLSCSSELLVILAESAQEARQRIDERSPDLIVLDLYLETEERGLEILRYARDRATSIPVVAISSFGDIAAGCRALQEGAVDFISKSPEFFFKVLPVKVLNFLRAGGANEHLEGYCKFSEIVGNSPKMMEALARVERVSPTPVGVLILGESGTGKELIARAIHSNSPRGTKQFVAVNCAGIPDTLLESELFGHVKGAFTGALTNREGKFKHADGGTIFLDEIGDMPLQLQAKVLRVLQEKEFQAVGSDQTERVDTRVIAATNQDLTGLVVTGRFRHDLYHRLNVFPIMLPPLRERGDDIDLLTRHFLRIRASELGQRVLSVASEAMAELRAYDYPGNVRELDCIVTRALILENGDEIRPGAVRDAFSLSPLSAQSDDLLRLLQLQFQPACEEFRLRYLTYHLKKAGGNASEAARLTGADRKRFSEVQGKKPDSSN